MEHPGRPHRFAALRVSMMEIESATLRPLERDVFRMNRHRALAYCLRMISAQTLRVCREGKPLYTFPDHALTQALAVSGRAVRGAFEDSTISS